MRSLARLPLDGTANAGLLDGRRARAPQHSIERRPHLTSCHRDAIAGRAVIEASMINEAATGIEHEEVRRALSIVRLCDGLGLVMKKRKREVVFQGHLAKLVRGVIRISDGIVGANRYEPNAFWLVMAHDSQNLITNMDDIGTMPADEHYEQGLGLGQFGEGDDPSGDNIREGEPGGRRSQRNGVE